MLENAPIDLGAVVSCDGLRSGNPAPINFVLTGRTAREKSEDSKLVISVQL
jgi:hypothetical protein